MAYSPNVEGGLPAALEPELFETEVVQGDKWRIWWRRHRLGIFGLVLLFFVLVAAFLGPYLYPVNPNSQSIIDRMLPMGSTGLDGTYYLLGTDSLGRDQLARVLHGARNSLMVVAVAVVAASIFGVVMGSVSGYIGGILDTIIMRIVDAQLALPTLVVAILISATIGGGYWNTAIILAIASWPIYARLARAEVLKIREENYIEAAIALGASDLRILVRHVAPNLISIVTVVASLELGHLILVESSLSFLGFGMQPPNATLGSMIRQGQNFVFNAWWISAIPGFFIMIAVLALNIVGDWLRDIFDPRMR